MVSKCRKVVKDRRQQATEKRTFDKPKWWNQEAEEAWEANMKSCREYTQSMKVGAGPYVVGEKRQDVKTPPLQTTNVLQIKHGNACGTIVDSSSSTMGRACIWNNMP
jgi:hypothetical protein